MTIRLNGAPHDLPEPVSIGALLARLDIDPRRVAVERNLTIVKRALYDSVMVQEGDEIEIVNVVGGGSAGQPAIHRNPDGMEPAWR